MRTISIIRGKTFSSRERSHPRFCATRVSRPADGYSPVSASLLDSSFEELRPCPLDCAGSEATKYSWGVKAAQKRDVHLVTTCPKLVIYTDSAKEVPLLQ